MDWGPTNELSIMGTARRKFTLEFKTETAHRAIDKVRTWSRSPVNSRERGAGPFVRDERMRTEAVARARTSD